MRWGVYTRGLAPAQRAKGGRLSPYNRLATGQAVRPVSFGARWKVAAKISILTANLAGGRFIVR
ncbi:hypothetical protein HYPP_00785 [Hyphomicrobium sp. ghe19]|nr:hypothetical protein HYPP_00785 [Hyphomicrobium sp. ghe19]